MATKHGQRVSTREGLDYVLMLELKHLIKRVMDGIIDFPASVHGQAELNRLIRRMQNRVIDYPRGDNGEFALTENLRRIAPNLLLSVPREDHGEYALLEVMRLRKENRLLSFPLLADGATDGKIKTTNITDYSIAGQVYSKAITNDLWDLSAFTPDTGAAEYQAVALWLDTSGTATTSKLALAASEAAALALLDAAIVSNPTLCLAGVYVAGLSTDWNAVAHLAAQGTYYNGYPAARTPAAVTAETETLVGDGGTAGNIKLLERIQYSVDGQVCKKAITDDLWDLSAFTPDVGAAKYRAVLLCLDVSGTASTVEGTDQDTSDAAVADLADNLPASKCVVAVYIGGNSCDWDAGGGLAGQGAYTQSFQDGLMPAAVTAELTARLVDGGTAGNIKLNQKLRFTIDGETHEKGITDDFWDLSAYVDVGALKHRAVALYIDAAGAASMQEGTDQDTEAAALAEVAALEVASKCVVGYFVGDHACDWDDGGGLAGQGTYEQSPPAETTMSEATVAGTTLLADGSTAGKVKLSNQVAYKNNGKSYVKAATDDFWDLSGKTDTTSVQYRAYGLCVNGGVAAIIEGANKTTAALAIADLGEKLVTGQAIIGVYVADPSTDFDGGAGLLSFGTYHDGFPEALAVNDVSWVQ